MINIFPHPTVKKSYPPPQQVSEELTIFSIHENIFWLDGGQAAYQACTNGRGNPDLETRDFIPILCSSDFAEFGLLVFYFNRGQKYIHTLTN